MNRNIFQTFVPFVALLLIYSCTGTSSGIETEAKGAKTNVRVEEVRLAPVSQLATFTTSRQRWGDVSGPSTWTWAAE